jgi:hypothetical protein
MSGIWKSESFRRLLLIAGTVIFALAMVELPAFLNILDYQSLQLNGVWGSMRFIRVADPELLYIEPPHAHHIGQAYGGDFAARYNIPASDKPLYRWDLKYDNHGFRNDTDLTSADISVIGDSMVEGMTVPTEESMTSLLAQSQHAAVANFGQYGYGPRQELAVLRRFALPLHPRTVIWVFFEGNDLQDLADYDQARLHPQNFWNRFLQRSFTRVAYNAAERLVGPGKPPGIARSGVFQTASHARLRLYFTYDAHPLTPAELDASGKTVDIIAVASKLTTAQGARILFVFAPDKFRVFHDFCQFPAESECLRWQVNDLPDRLQAALGAISPEIGYLNLTPYLVAAARQGGVPYYPDDIHWSPLGHGIAAEAISGYLQQYQNLQYWKTSEKGGSTK